MSHDSDVLDRLAGRLKDARQARGLSLEAVAALSGVSRSMVSQIERGSSSPTVATLWNLTRALQVDFAGLLDEDPAAPRIDITRARDIPAIGQHGSGCHIRILSPPEDAGRHEAYDLEFDAGGVLDSAPHSVGTHESLSVISGQIEVRSDAASEMLGPGDTARYRADCAHRISAPDGPARAFLIVQSG